MHDRPAPTPTPRSALPVQARLIVAVGIASALHVGKLPPALPLLAQELGLTLVQGGFLLSMIQFAGMTLGALLGQLADRLGPRRVMMVGLVLLAAGSALGAVAPGAAALLGTRGLEGVGFLMTVLPAPALLRRTVTEPGPLNRALGWWGAYMPIGAATGLLVTPLAYATIGWRLTWAVLAVLAALCAAGVRVYVAPDGPRARDAQAWAALRHGLHTTLSAPGPWLVASAFLMYSGQWLAVVGFLPTLYTEAGWSPARVGWASALVAGVNLTGNIAAGRLLARGVAPRSLLWTGYGAMALGAVGTFTAGAGLAYASALVFSAVGGLIPGTLFALAVRLAPGPQTVSTTVGWVQQWSSLGQFVGPPLVAALAARVGGWQWTWTVNVACCAVGALLAAALHARLAQQVRAPRPGQEGA
ncbi:putative sialic acid transporter [Tepidimonas thermarum]|uniref:Putative sialic acid transporter n=1 Tax=Tepidimonas thermarum TaxID=335431 RepID=A0A554X6W4_9BURK|nr:MFS transporter [Tepidimonas thermarum]TSE31570.1 putative sialic acid transporter [Tepidimonas thermarum]